MIPSVAIIGRPNVGKSALFNRLAEKRHAIVSEVFGTTRDVLSTTIIIKRKQLEILDTAGIIGTMDNTDPLLVPVQQQARAALEDADLILFCVDTTTPLTSDDTNIAKILRSSHKPVVLVITKCDNTQLEHATSEFYKLGFDTPIFISSIHNRGIDILKETIHTSLKEAGLFHKDHYTPSKKLKHDLSFCLVGKPNVGKSSLFNAMVHKSKAVVSDIPGTTRDTIDSIITYEDKDFLIIDTAGMKRPGRVEKGIEKYSTLRTFRAIKRSDICLLVIDANEKISNMDHAVSRYVLEEKKGLILIVNKWDLMETEKDIMDKFLTYLQDRFDYVPWAPVLFVSAKTGKNVSVIIDQVQKTFEHRQLRVETGRFNRFVAEATAKHAPKGTKKIPPKIFYATQIETNPPHFLLFVNEKDAFHFSWIRYFEKKLREKFGFEGTPITIELRNRERERKERK